MTCATAVPRISSGGYSCNICGRSYSHHKSLNDHRKMHEGRTSCHLCGKVATKVADLRAHLFLVHKLSREDVRSLVPTRPKNPSLPTGPML